MIRNPFAALRQAALLLALREPVDPRSITSSETHQRRVAPGTKSGRRLNSRIFRNRGTYFDPKLAGRTQSLRNRMGGNAQRILHARLGQVFDGQQYVESPTILPEEVEARANEYRKWQDDGFEYHPGDYFITEIRGHRVQLWPYMLGPVRYKVLS